MSSYSERERKRRVKLDEAAYDRITFQYGRDNDVSEMAAYAFQDVAAEQRKIEELGERTKTGHIRKK